MPLENTDAEERITRETMIGWIEHWGESYDDVRPDDGAMRLANRIIEYNAATETIEALRNPDAVYDELASILQPVLSSMDGTYFAGSEWFAGEVDRMEADRINGEQPEETDGLASEEPRIPFNMCAPPGATPPPTTGRSSWPNHAPRANGRPTRTGSPYWA